MHETDRRWIVTHSNGSPRMADALAIFLKNGRNRQKTLRELERE
jgi:hypothetical protein